jgi:flagellar hook-basal body complex protein FliE
MKPVSFEGPRDVARLLDTSRAQLRKTEPPPLTFGETVRQAIDDVNRLQSEADREIASLAAGKNTDLHRTMIAMEKANISFQFLMQVRNKIVSAYQEIMRMQI